MSYWELLNTQFMQRAIIAAVFAAMFSNGLRARLLLSWAFGIAVAAAGTLGSLQLDMPTGAAIVVAFGMALVLAAVARAVMTRTGLATGETALEASSSPRH